MDETTGMQQRLQHTDEAVIMQFEAGDAALSDECESGQCGEFTSIDCTGQQLSLLQRLLQRDAAMWCAKTRHAQTTSRGRGVTWS